ncbi:MAG: AMP-binding protein, partial [Saprospiraceae bacterium]
MTLVRNRSLFGPQKTSRVLQDDGTVYYSSTDLLQAYPEKITQKLIHWSSVSPDKTFLAQRDHHSKWNCLTYKNALLKVKTIAQYLLNQHISDTESIVILSENSIEHGLLALAAMYIGIPYSPISPAYSMISDDFIKLGHCLKAMTPKIIFVQDQDKFHRAIQFAKNLFPQALVMSAEDVNSIATLEDS